MATTDPVPPAMDAGQADTPVAAPTETPKPGRPVSQAEASEIKILTDMVKAGTPPDAALACLKAIERGAYADSDTYFAAHPFTPMTRNLSTQSVPAAPDFGGYLNLQYAYKALIAKGETAQDAEEYVTTIAALAGLTRDADVYLDDGAHPRRLLRVGAARLPVS